MTISEHVTTFFGRKVVELGEDPTTIDPTQSAVAVRVGWDDTESIAEKLARLRGSAIAPRVEAVVIGLWAAGESVAPGDVSSANVIEDLAKNAAGFPALRALMLGDITFEECEVSWLRQSSVAPLFEAFPLLEHFTVRGGNELRFGALKHAKLRELVVQTGGLASVTIEEILTAHLPSLRHLELWLGSEGYGFDGSVQTFGRLLSGELFPSLRSLGLKNSEITDELAEVVSSSRLLDRLRALDLSLGTLSDAGAEALLAEPRIARLATLDLHHHYVTAPLVERLAALGPAVDVSEREEGDENNRYCALSE